MVAKPTAEAVLVQRAAPAHLGCAPWQQLLQSPALRAAGQEQVAVADQQQHALRDGGHAIRNEAVAHVQETQLPRQGLGGQDDGQRAELRQQVDYALRQRCCLHRMKFVRVRAPITVAQESSRS